MVEFLLTTTTTTDSSSALSMLTMFGPIVLLFVVMYFFIIRPQRKREKDTKKMLENLKRGDNIVTIGGLYGRVVSMKPNYVTIEVGPQKVQMVFERSSVKTVERPITDDEPEEKKKLTDDGIDL